MANPSKNEKYTIQIFLLCMSLSGFFIYTGYLTTKMMLLVAGGMAALYIIGYIHEIKTKKKGFDIKSVYERVRKYIKKNLFFCCVVLCGIFIYSGYFSSRMISLATMGVVAIYLFNKIREKRITNTNKDPNIKSKLNYANKYIMQHYFEFPDGAVFPEKPLSVELNSDGNWKIQTYVDLDERENTKDWYVGEEGYPTRVWYTIIIGIDKDKCFNNVGMFFKLKKKRNANRNTTVWW